MPKPPAPPPQTTRDELVNAALRLFGQNGYDATTTRQIAAAAGANISAISYYFGGKEGLRVACADLVGETLSATVITRIPDPLPQTQADAEEALSQMFSALLNLLLLQPVAAELSRFLLREIADPGAVVARLYPRFLEPLLRSASTIWATATGQEEAETDAVRLTLFSMIGQTIYFNIGRAIICRRQGWDKIGPDEAAAIEAVVQSNLKAILAEARKGATG